MRKGISLTTKFGSPLAASMLATTLFLVSSAFAQAPTPAVPSVDGSWLGSLEVDPGRTARIDLEFGHTPNGAFGGDLFVPDQSRFGVGLDTAYASDSRVHAAIAKLSVSIDATLSQDGSTLTGTWRQGTKSTSITLHRATLWSGDITVPESQVQMAMKVKETNGGQLDGIISNLSDTSKKSEVVVSGSKLSDGSVFIANSTGAVTFEGKMVGSEMAGFWRQEGKAYPLGMKKGSDGSYVGPLRILAHPAGMIFKFATDTGNQLVAVFRSVESNVTEVPVDTIRSVGQSVTLSLPSIGATFTGEQAKDGSNIAGKWNQNGHDLPLTITKFVPQPATPPADSAAEAKPVEKPKSKKK